MFDVCEHADGLALVTKHDVAMPRTSHGLVLLSDQLQCCGCRITNGGIEKLCELVIINLVSGSHALLTLPELFYTTPTCSWTRRGYAVTFAQTVYDNHRPVHQYKVFNLVC